MDYPMFATTKRAIQAKEQRRQHKKDNNEKKGRSYHQKEELY